MARKTKTTVPHRRKREGRTDYKKRLKYLLSKKPRMVVRKSTRGMLVQLIAYEASGDKIIVSAQTNELKKLGWDKTGNTPAAYLVGYLAGKKMIAKGIKDTILDQGLQAQSTRIYACLKGVIDAGVNVPYDEKIMPKEERINGSQFNLSKQFEQTKEKIK